MTREEVLRKIKDARSAIEQYRREGLGQSSLTIERQKIAEIQQESIRLLAEAKTLGAAGQTCPTCGGSGRI